VHLGGTHARALDIVPLDVLRAQTATPDQG